MAGKKPSSKEETPMKIVIIGLGSIGRTILKNLDGERHTITVIDDDKELVERLIERYDVSGVVGNGARMDIQQEARVGEADLVIALTRNDELNIFACLVAKRLGVRKTVARVREPAYRRQIAMMKDALGISMAARAGCALVGESLISLGRKLRSRVLICAVRRGDEVFIPSGGFVIREGDRIHFTADAKTLGEFLSEVDLVESPLRHILIVGGGRIGFYLADALSERKYAVKLIEEDPDRAEILAEMLPHVTVACGNGTRHGLLLEEGIEAVDAFAALTDADEENMIVSMFANKCGVKKAIARIESDDLFGMLDQLGVDNHVSTRQVVAGRILSYVRALANSRGSSVRTLYRLVNDRVEALEFAARNEESIYNRPLKELRIRDNCLIACIIRGDEVIIPNGNSQIHRGDNVVVVTTHKNFDDLTDVFE